MAYPYAAPPVKAVQSVDGKVYYIIHNNDGETGFAKIRYVDFYSGLQQIPLNERSENILYWVNQAATVVGGDNEGDPRVKYGWGLYLWHVHNQKYYLIAQQEGEDYVVKPDLDAYLKIVDFNIAINRINTSIIDIQEINAEQTYWIEWLKNRLGGLRDSLHTHLNKDVIDQFHEENGILYFGDQALGGNSYLYSVRDEDNRIYWKNPTDPLDVDMNCNTAFGIAEKFCSCSLCHEGLTLIVADNDDTLAIFRMIVNRREKAYTQIWKFSYEGMKLFNNSKRYFFKNDLGEYTELTSEDIDVRVNNTYLKQFTTYDYHWLSNIGFHEENEFDQAGWNEYMGILDDVFLKQDGAYLPLEKTSIQDLLEKGIITVHEGDTSGTMYFTGKVTMLYTRTVKNYQTIIKPTMGMTPSEDLDFYGEYFNPGEGVYSGVINTVRMDALWYEARFDQVITLDSFGRVTRVPTLPAASEKWYRMGLWSPMEDTPGYPALHFYKCEAIMNGEEIEGYYWKDVTAGLTDDIKGVNGASIYPAWTSDNTMWKSNNLLWVDPPAVTTGTDGRVHLYDHTIIVRKFGSAPQHPGDGTIVANTRLGFTEASSVKFRDLTQYSGGEAFYRAFSFDAHGAMYVPTAAVHPEPITWDYIRTLTMDDDNKTTKLIRKVFSVGDSIVLPPHEIYGEIECIITNFTRHYENQHWYMAMDVVSKDVLCNKEMDAKEYCYFRTSDDTSNLTNTGKDYFIEEGSGENLRFIQIDPSVSSTAGHNIYERIMASEAASYSDQTVIFSDLTGAPNGAADWRLTNLRAWLNSDNADWYGRGYHKCDAKPSYSNEIGFMSGFGDDTSMFMLRDTDLGDRVSIPADGISSAEMAPNIAKMMRTKSNAAWWTSSSEPNGSDDPIRMKFVGNNGYLGSAYSYNEMGVRPTFRLA